MKNQNSLKYSLEDLKEYWQNLDFEYNIFFVNDFTKILNFKIIDFETEIFLKFGVENHYLKFEGKIENKKVKGFINVDDETIYKLEYL